MSFLNLLGVTSAISSASSSELILRGDSFSSPNCFTETSTEVIFELSEGASGIWRHAGNSPPATSARQMFKTHRLFLLNKLTLIKITIFVNMSTENFEYKTAMERLESILERIDNSEMEIDELAGAVQEATELLRKCRQILLATEKNVQEALSGLDGETEAGA